jgi:hypothetical protein
MPVPVRPKGYHITHVDNLPGIVAQGGLWSDCKRLELQLDCTLVGMSKIKQRRLELVVSCHAPHRVGEFVPFYFGPRSVMLYILARGNHPEVHHHGGQDPILHLVVDVLQVVAWASEDGRPWACSASNAGASYAEFSSDLTGLRQIDWNAVDQRDWRDPVVKEHKQAEFLVHERLPWTLVERIGVRTEAVATQVRAAIRDSAHQPLVEVRSDWYY